MSFIEGHESGVVIHALAIRLAKQCRELIQCGFREEEWIDIDFEFYQLLREGLQEFHCGTRAKLSQQHSHSN